MSGKHYVKNIIANIEGRLKKHGCQFNDNQKSPFTQGYHPDMDTSAELDDDEMNYYQEMTKFL